MFKLNEAKIKNLYIKKERLALAFCAFMTVIIITARSYWFYIFLTVSMPIDYLSIKRELWDLLVILTLILMNIIFLSLFCKLKHFY